jgi:hypothetical protein
MRSAPGGGASATERRTRSAGDLIEAFDSSLDDREIYARLANAVVESLADWCVVYESRPRPQGLEQAALASSSVSDPDSDHWRDGESGWLSLVERALEENKPFLLSHESPDPAADPGNAPPETRIIRGDWPVIVAPLRTRNRTLGAGFSKCGAQADRSPTTVLCSPTSPTERPFRSIVPIYTGKPATPGPLRKRRYGPATGCSEM